MAELSSVLDALAEDDLHALTGPALLERTAELVAARNRIDAELARTTRRAELAQAPEHDGLKSMASWLRGHSRLSARAAGLLVRNGRALEHLPAVAAGCAAGQITADQLAVIAPSPARRTWPPPPTTASTWPGSTASSPESPSASGTTGSPRWCTST
jgi:hypothetical protein